ncbi:MAG: DNA alkylation repair protein [Patescibacteria group bacterium]|jgi:3-methyladenine DNA glycosylase AlkD
MSNLAEVIAELKKLANPQQAKNLSRFFKTGKGDYGEGDIFLGIKVPVQRQVVKKYQDLPLKDAESLLRSKIHEHRLVVLLILVDQFNKADEAKRRSIFNIYLKNTAFINNWDLVDLSAPNIVGTYLLDKPRGILYKLARSTSLWERRVAMLATFTFLRNKNFKDALAIAEILLNDQHDLIHKAVGWMLREMGKRDQAAEEKFLQRHYKAMPRTMLRYAIERFPESKRLGYLKK